MKEYTLFILLFVNLIQSCTIERKNASDEQEQTFVRTNFAKTKELKMAQEIVIPDLLNPASFRVIHDSVLIVNNQPGCDYFLELYSLKTLQPIVQLVPKGNGPGEMKSCWLSLHTNDCNQFYLQDDATKTYYTVDIDSILINRKLHILSKFRYSSEILSSAGLCMIDDKGYIGYHQWYLDNKEYNNGINSPLKFFKMNEDSKKSVRDFRYFVSQVNGTQIFVNPQDRQVWSIDMHRDRICIYNDSLRLVKIVNGPDQFSPDYTVRENRQHIPFVIFADELNYRAYIDYYVTDKHIYLVYEGTKHFNPENMLPVEIFKLDFEGNPLCNYKVDRHIYSISIDKKEQYLYGVARSSVLKEPVFLKYEL